MQKTKTEVNLHGNYLGGRWLTVRQGDFEFEFDWFGVIKEAKMQIAAYGILPNVDESLILWESEQFKVKT